MASETKYSLPRVMTVKELSDYLRVHPSTIYKLLRRGELPGLALMSRLGPADFVCRQRRVSAGAGFTTPGYLKYIC